MDILTDVTQKEQTRTSAQLISQNRIKKVAIARVGYSGPSMCVFACVTSLLFLYVVQRPAHTVIIYIAQKLSSLSF